MSYPSIIRAQQERIQELETLLRAVIHDYDRRNDTLRGRFLLWLLRKTT